MLKNSVLVLQMDKFRQKSTELWPLFQNNFLCIENIPWRGMLHSCSAYIWLMLFKRFLNVGSNNPNGKPVLNV